MIDDKLRDKIEKIKSLAERGIGGEKETAQKKLEKLLKEHNLTIDSLNSGQVNYYLFSYSDSISKTLLGQIIFKVLGKGSGIYRSKGKRMKLGAYCTPAQKIEIELDYEFYLNLFNDEVKELLSAFIQQQDLFPEDVEVKQVNLDELSPEEKSKLMKQQVYRNNMVRRTRNKAIEDKNR